MLFPKGHLQKVVVKQLIQRVIANIKNKYYSHSDVSSSSSTKCPPSLTSSVKPILENLERVKEQVKRNEGVILQSLHGLTDEQLKRLTEVFGAKSWAGEKLSLAENIFGEEDFEKIQSSIDYLEFLKMQCFVPSFGHEFNTTRADSVSFDRRDF